MSANPHRAITVSAIEDAVIAKPEHGVIALGGAEGGCAADFNACAGCPFKGRRFADRINKKVNRAFIEYPHLLMVNKQADHAVRIGLALVAVKADVLLRVSQVRVKPVPTPRLHMEDVLVQVGGDD